MTAPVTADELARQVIIRAFRRDTRFWERTQPGFLHLRECPQISLEDPEASDGYCSEGTCEMVKFETVVTCPHDQRMEYWYDVPGTLADMLDEDHSRD